MKKILVLGGTRFFGKHLVNALLSYDYDVTIATRGLSEDSFGKRVKRIQFDRYDEQSIRTNLTNDAYDIIYDNIAYCSDDIEILLPLVTCKTYIVTSSTAVYNPLAGEILEKDFDSTSITYERTLRNKEQYAQGKRLVEAALTSKAYSCKTIFVRFPYVIGRDDYTKRMKQYIDAYVHETSLYIDNLYNKMSFIDAKEAGRFLAYLSCVDYHGAINAATSGQLSIYDILKLVCNKLHQTEDELHARIDALFCSSKSIQAPYNQTQAYKINVSTHLTTLC